MKPTTLLALKNWFLANQRDLPWRQNRSPYAIWVSEVMLQQTQAATVVPYFNKWMEQFPDLETLAAASTDQVLKAWEGLGYYSRARNLHEGAKYILKQHQGVFPQNPSEIAKIKGIGPYTLGAIASFAFHQPLAAVDGNVIRVLARYYGFEDDIAKASTIKQIRTLAQKLLPEQESWIVSEALIELGALICLKNPKCNLCPLASTCQAYLQGKTDLLPLNSKKTAISLLNRIAIVIKHKNFLLVKRVKEKEIMSGLHEFPYLEVNQEISAEQLSQKIETQFPFKLEWMQDLPTVKHSFTRFRVILNSKIYQTEIKGQPPEEYKWISLEDIENLAFSSGHRQIIEHLIG